MNVDLEPLEEQVTVITGASSGIGLVTARMAAERGARVVLAARSDDALQEVTEEINHAGGDATYVVADVSDRDDVRAIAAVAQDEYGGFDTWINVASAFLYGRLEDTPVEDMRELFETNAWGTVYGSLRPLPTCDGAAVPSSTSGASRPTGPSRCRAFTPRRNTPSRGSPTPCGWNWKRRTCPSP